MTAQNSRLLIIAGMLIGCVLHGPALAEEDIVLDQAGVLPDVTVEAVAGVAIPETLPETTPFGNSAITSEALDVYRGGTEISVENDNFLSGVVGDNQAYNLTTGSNLITEGSLAGASGLSTVIQNSGNNVLIQNSTIVNLQVK